MVPRLTRAAGRLCRQLSLHQAMVALVGTPQAFGDTSLNSAYCSTDCSTVWQVALR